MEHINSLSGEASEINSFMEKKAAELLEEASREADSKYITKGLTTKYKADVLSQAEPILLKFAIRTLIVQAGVSIKDVTRNHVDQLCELITKTGSGQIDLPKRVTVVKESGIVYVRPPEGFDGQIQEVKEEKISKIAPVEVPRKEPVPERAAIIPETPVEPAQSLAEGSQDKYMCPVTGEGNYILPDGTVITCRVLNEFDREDIPEDTYTKWMDYAKMTDDLCLRTRRTGDYLVINTKGNEGNLKNYMINEKIPKSERDEVPLLASGSKIYWVIGHRISEDVKVTEDTKVVIEFTCKRPEEGVNYGR